MHRNRHSASGKFQSKILTAIDQCKDEGTGAEGGGGKLVQSNEENVRENRSVPPPPPHNPSFWLTPRLVFITLPLKKMFRSLC